MNKTIENILNHTSIRSWKNEEISEKIIDTLFNVINRTASSMAMQHFSVIRVKDKKKRKAIKEVSTQPYIEIVPELFIFIVDCYRNSMIAKENKELFESGYDADRFFQGFTDASISAQNLTNAAESLDLGCVYFGSILNDTKKIIEILNLPKYTFPVVGVGFGYKNQEPELKPRIKTDLKIFEDSYKTFESYSKIIEEYDRELETYYDLRNTKKPVDSFTKQILNILSNPNPKRSDIANVIRSQGFTL